MANDDKILPGYVKWLLIILIIIFLAGVILIYFPLTQQSSRNVPDKITNFIECSGAGYPVAESYPRQCRTPDGDVFIEELNPNLPPQDGQMGIKGVIDCLPKKGSSQQTMECAIGLRGNDGKYYILKNLAQIDPERHYSEIGIGVDIYGNFKREEVMAPDGNMYDVVGSIRIDNITNEGN